MKPYGVLLCLILAGCAPAYIADLDRAAGLTRHLTLVGTIVLGDSDAGSQGALRFLPVKPVATSVGGLTIQSGFLVTSFAGGEQLSFVYTDSSGNVQTSGSYPFSLAGADPNYPLFQFDVGATTATANLVVTYLNPSSPGSNYSELFTATLPYGPLTVPTTFTNPLPCGTFDPYGSCVSAQDIPNPAPSQDSFYLMAINGTGGVVDQLPTLNGVTSVFPTPTGATPAPATLPSLPSQVYRFLAYYSTSSGVEYADYDAGGQWRCYQWTQGVSADVSLMAGVTHRIDAVLTSGDLLSTEGGILRLYDPNSGSQVVSASLGGLQYCYEAYVGPTPCVFFSLPLGLQNGSWAFAVYVVPTSSMRSLGG